MSDGNSPSNPEAPVAAPAPAVAPVSRDPAAAGPPLFGGLSRSLSVLIAAGALLHLVLVGWIVWQRIDYPFDLEWIEGSSAVTVGRILNGEPFYVAPTLEYTPYLYTPLYFWLSALVAQFTGLSLYPLRLVSVAASLGTMVLLFWFARRETRSSYFGLLAAGMFAACYKTTAFWFDIGRVDCLFNFLVLATAFALRVAKGARGLALAAVLMFLAFFTKQSGIFVAAPLSLYAFLAHRGRDRWVFPVLFGVLAGVATAVMTWLSDGWFWYYVFDMPSGHSWLPRHWVQFWTHDLLRHLPVTVGIGVLWTVLQVFERRPGARLYFPIAFLALVGSAYVQRLHSGSGANVLLLACTLFSLYFGLGLHAAVGRGVPPGVAKVMVQALCVVQLIGSSIHEPRAQVPLPDFTKAREALVERLRAIDGDVYLHHPAFIATLAGKPNHSDCGAIGDIFRSTTVRSQEVGAALRAEISEAIRSRRYAAFVVGKPYLGYYIDGPEFVAELREHYEAMGPVVPNPALLAPVTGMFAAPHDLFLRRDE
ncbi:MAG: glycosyltransferase family 39 protein [Planctomycetota bacterium]